MNVYIPDPCKNGASYEDMIGLYLCHCTPDYTGVDCEFNIDDKCSVRPCKHGATCEDMADSYRCRCVAGYTGTDCENDIDDCASEPCHNGGTCSDGADKFSCLCLSGYQGDSCEDRVDTAAPTQAAAGNKETVIIGATLGPVILVIIIVALVALVVGFMMYKSRTSKRYDFSQGPTPNITVGDNPTYASSGHLMAAYTAAIPPDTSAPLFSNPFYGYKQEEDDTTPVCTSAGNVVGSAVVGSPDTAHLFSNPLYDFNPKEGGNLMSTYDAVGLIAASPPDKLYHFQNPPYDCDHKDDETETGDNATIHCVEAGLINTSPGDEVCYASIS